MPRLVAVGEDTFPGVISVSGHDITNAPHVVGQSPRAWQFVFSCRTATEPADDEIRDPEGSMVVDGRPRLRRTDARFGEVGELSMSTVGCAVPGA
jgi:hypothetical protein